MTDPAAPVTITALATEGTSETVTMTMRRDQVKVIKALLSTEIRQLERLARQLGLSPHHPAADDIGVIWGIVNAALASPAPEPPADDLAALIAECEAHDWEWRLQRVWVEDGPDAFVVTRIASVKPLAWQGARFDETDEDGWLGLSDDDAAGSMSDLLRETMQAANEHTNPHARVNMDAARQAAGAGDGAEG